MLSSDLPLMRFFLNLPSKISSRHTGFKTVSDFSFFPNSLDSETSWVISLYHPHITCICSGKLLFIIKMRYALELPLSGICLDTSIVYAYTEFDYHLYLFHYLVIMDNWCSGYCVGTSITRLLKVFHRSDGRHGFEKYFKLYCVLHSSSNENWFSLSTNTVLATKFPTDFNSTRLCFPTNCSKGCYIDILFFQNEPNI